MKVAIWTECIPMAARRAPTLTRRYTLRAGRKGTGRILWEGSYWPDSAISCATIDRACAAAERALSQVGWTILPATSRDDED